MDGEVSADGAALGLMSRFPIFTERTSLTFPECKYGFFPDAGLSKFLSSLGGYGMYLALTGHKLQGHDLMVLGLGRYFVEHCTHCTSHSFLATVETLLNELSQNHSRNSDRIESIIESISTPLPAPSEEVMSLILNCK